MNKASLSLLAFAAGMVTLMALPPTRWVVLNHGDYVWGLRERPALQDLYNQSGHGPDFLLMNAQVSSASESIAFGAAYDQVERYDPPPGQWHSYAKVAPLREFVQRYPNNVSARALMMVEVSAGTISAVTKSAPRDAEMESRVREALAETEFAFKGTEKLDTDNAFFPVMRAVGLYAAGREREARDMLLLASTKTRYDEHAYAACEARWKAYEDRYGYRGQRARLIVLANYILPQNTSIPKFAQALCASGDVEARLASARLAMTMMRSSPEIIDLYTGARIASYAATGYSPTDRTDLRSGASQKRAFEQIDRIEANGHDPQHLLRTAYELASRVRGRDLPEFGGHSMDLLLWTQLSWEVAQGVWIAVVLLAIGAALLGRALDRKQTAPHLWANLVWPTALLTAQPVGAVAVWTLCAFLLIQALAYWRWKDFANRYWWGLALAGALAVGLMGQADWPELSWASLAFLVASFTSRLEVRPAWAKVAVFNVSLLGSVVPVAFVGDAGDGLRYSLPLLAGVFLALALAAVALSPKMKPSPRHSYAWAVVLLGVAYLVTVGFELHADGSLQVTRTSLDRELTDFRANVGID